MLRKVTNLLLRELDVLNVARRKLRKTVFDFGASESIIGAIPVVKFHRQFTNRDVAASRMNLDRVPEAFRQVSPRNPCPVAVKHRLDKQPIVPCGNTDMPLTTRQKVSYALPLIITKGVAAHRSTPNQVDLP